MVTCRGIIQQYSYFSLPLLVILINGKNGNVIEIIVTLYQSIFNMNILILFWLQLNNHKHGKLDWNLAWYATSVLEHIQAVHCITWTQDGIGAKYVQERMIDALRYEYFCHVNTFSHSKPIKFLFIWLVLTLTLWYILANWT